MNKLFNTRIFALLLVFVFSASCSMRVNSKNNSQEQRTHDGGVNSTINSFAYIKIKTSGPSSCLSTAFIDFGIIGYYIDNTEAPVELKDCTIGIDGTSTGSGALAINNDIFRLNAESAGIVTIRATCFPKNLSDSINITVDKDWHNPKTTGEYISYNTSSASSASVAMDNQGNVIVVWLQADSSGKTQVFKSEYRNGAWRHPANLDDNISFDGTNAQDVAVAMDNNNNAIIVWSQSDGAKLHIYKTEYRGGSWQAAENMSPDGPVPGGADGEYARNPQVAMNDNGEAIIVWRQWGPGSYSQIFKSEYKGGVWIKPADVNDNISPDDRSVSNEAPSVSINKSGEIVIAWVEMGGLLPGTTGYSIMKSEYRGGAWIHPADKDDRISPYLDGVSAANVKTAINDDGDAVIVWKQNNGSVDRIYKSEYLTGAWVNPTINNGISPNGISAAFPVVAIDNSNNIVIAWQSNNSIFMSEHRGGSWSYPADASDYVSPAGTNAYAPYVVMNSNSTALLTWFQKDGSNNYQIFKSEYKNNSWSFPTNINDNISADGPNAWSPKAAMNSDGKKIIVWDQKSSSGLQGIFKSEYK